MKHNYDVIYEKFDQCITNVNQYLEIDSVDDLVESFYDIYDTERHMYVGEVLIKPVVFSAILYPIIEMHIPLDDEFQFLKYNGKKITRRGSDNWVELSVAELKKLDKIKKYFDCYKLNGWYNYELQKIDIVVIYEEGLVVLLCFK
jgi:hypothetical protein